MPELATDQSYLRDDQYRDATNLDARLQLHVRFSTNKYGWFEWVFDRLLRLPPSCRLLELGCGPGSLWQANRQRVPSGWHVTLSDFSTGMLQQARANMADCGRSFTFEVIDAQCIPFGDAAFDAVIANHMLYHVPDLACALSEVRRVLKPGGRFFTSTVGDNHLREISDLVHRFDAGLTFRSFDGTFTLENGRPQLEQWFSDVTLSRYDDTFVINEPGPLSAYVLSGPSVPPDMSEAFARFVKEEMKAQPVFHVTKDTGIFEASWCCNDTIPSCWD